MTIRNLSPAVIVLACGDVVLALFGRSPDRLGLKDLHALQVHLEQSAHIVAGLGPVSLCASVLFGLQLTMHTGAFCLCPNIAKDEETVQFL